MVVGRGGKDKRFARVVTTLYRILVEFGLADVFSFAEFCDAVNTAYELGVPTSYNSLRNFLAGYLVAKKGWNPYKAQYIASTFKGMREWKKAIKENMN